jgi:thiamine biosynthesis lipoprotein ApbE
VTDRVACWVWLPENAAMCDALSTAAMIMPVEKIQAMQTKQPGLSVMLLMADGKGNDQLMRWGNWAQD